MAGRMVGLIRLLRRVIQAVRVRLLDPAGLADYFRQQGASIGEGTRLLTRSLGGEPFLVEIGKDTLVAAEVLFLTHDGGVWVTEEMQPQVNRFGRIRIGSRCFIGVRAILLPGIEIGDHCVVGAGAVVTRDVPSGSVVAGIPARVVSTIEDYNAKVIRESVQLPEEFYPLNLVDREDLRAHLDKLV